MSEIAKFVEHGASKITPNTLRIVHKKLPFLKLKFAEIDDPNFPHLSDQLEFLANVVEDFAENAADDLPFVTAAAATFALVYADRQFDLIPDTIPEFGHADDSGVVRAVLIQHERVLVNFAERRNMKWDEISLNP